MDSVLVDFEAGIDRLSQETREKYRDNLDEIPGFFRDLPPVDGALDAFQRLSAVHDSYILSTPPWDNPSAWTDKLLWVKEHLPQTAYKRLILSHRKHLNRGDYLIDDRTANGADKFTGRHIHFGHEPFEDWEAVLDYLL